MANNYYSEVLNRICLALEEKGITQKQLCESLGLKNKSFTEWKAGRSTSYMKKLPQIANFLNVSLDYLWGKETTYDFDIFSVPGISPIKSKKLPILGSVACGEPIWAEEEYQGYVSCNENINADFCLLAKGDSMINAGIKDGSIVFVKRQPTVDNGQIAVVLIEDEATLKRVYFDDKNKRLILNPENSAYTPIIIENDQLQSGQVRILGKAVACQFKIR